MNILKDNIKLQELELDFQSIFQNFHQSKIRQTQLDQDIDQLFANFGIYLTLKKNNFLFNRGALIQY